MGELIGDISELLFRDPNCFRAGELHNHFEYWQYIERESPSPQQAQILGWINDKVSIQPFFKHFKGSFKGESYDSNEPPMNVFKNNVFRVLFVTNKPLRHRLFPEKDVVTEVHNSLVDYNCKMCTCVSLYLELLSYGRDLRIGSTLWITLY